MDPKFGRGPKELGGAVDLIHHYKLWQHHELFCKRSLPPLISKSCYLNNVVGDTEIRKGEGMELDQLFKNAHVGERKEHINPFCLDILREAFLMRESAPIDLPASDKGKPTNVEKVKRGKKESERKRKKHTERDEKEKKHKKHKHRHKDHTDAKINVQNNQRDSGREQLNGQLKKVVTCKPLYKQQEDKRQTFSAFRAGQKISRQNTRRV